jgi:hypothetical protein
MVLCNREEVPSIIDGKFYQGRGDPSKLLQHELFNISWIAAQPSSGDCRQQRFVDVLTTKQEVCVPTSTLLDEFLSLKNPEK